MIGEKKVLKSEYKKINIEGEKEWEWKMYYQKRWRKKKNQIWLCKNFNKGSQGIRMKQDRYKQ